MSNEAAPARLGCKNCGQRDCGGACAWSGTWTPETRLGQSLLTLLFLVAGTICGWVCLLCLEQVVPQWPTREYQPAPAVVLRSEVKPDATLLKWDELLVEYRLLDDPPGAPARTVISHLWLDYVFEERHEAERKRHELYEVGMQVQAYVDPDDRERSVLVQGFGGRLGGMIVWASFSGLMAFLLIPSTLVNLFWIVSRGPLDLETGKPKSLAEAGDDGQAL